MTEQDREIEEVQEGEQPLELADILESRAAFYEMLASLYFRPLKQEQIDNMAQTDFTPYADVNEYFADGINDITRFLRKRNSGTRQTLAVDFTGAFIGTSTYKGRTAVPYKSVFTSKEGLMYQEGYQEVFKAFKAECVKRREGLDWPDDHLSFMFQFMALLSHRTVDALEKGDTDAAIHNLEVSQQFLADHIASWYDDFWAMANLLIKTRFYRGVLKITKGFIVLDTETLADLLEEVRG